FGVKSAGSAEATFVWASAAETGLVMNMASTQYTTKPSGNARRNVNFPTAARTISGPALGAESPPEGFVVVVPAQPLGPLEHRTADDGARPPTPHPVLPVV